MPRKIQDKSINFDPASSTGVDANDVKYDAGTTVKEKLDNAQSVPIAADYATSQDTDLLRKLALSDMIQDVSPPSVKLGLWSDTKGTYIIGDHVSHNGRIYKCRIVNDFNDPKEPGVDTYYWNDITATLQIDDVDSYIHVGTSNGYGSTYSAIRRFTDIIGQTGDDITYADSATNGATFTINKSGLYSIEMVDCTNTTDHIGVSRNGNPALNIYLLPIEQRLIHLQTVSTNLAHGSCTTKLEAGDVIRMHSRDTNTEGAYPSQVMLRITRIGDLESQGSFTRDTALLSAYRDTNHTINATDTDVVFDQVDWDIHNAYNSSTGEYTVPSNMKLRIAAQVRSGSSANVWLKIFVNGAMVAQKVTYAMPAFTSIEVIRIIDLQQGDVVKIVGESSSAHAFLGTVGVTYLQLNQEVAGDATVTDKGELHEFTSADISAGILSITHQLGQKHVIQTVMDNEGDQVPVWPTFINNNTIQYDFTGITVTGTWSVALGIGGRNIADVMTADQKDVVSQDYNVVDLDAGKTIDMDSPVNQNVNIQLYSTEPISKEGRQWIISRLGVGTIDIVATAGVTLNGIVGGVASISDQYSSVLLRCKDPINNIWVIEGNHGGVA